MNARPDKVPTGGGEKRIAKPTAKGKTTAQGKTSTKLLVAMTGKASDAKTADGDVPVFAYVASLPACRSRSAALPSASMPWRLRRCRAYSVG